jgi:hypothetical protein
MAKRCMPRIRNCDDRRIGKHLLNRGNVFQRRSQVVTAGAIAVTVFFPTEGRGIQL